MSKSMILTISALTVASLVGEAALVADHGTYHPGFRTREISKVRKAPDADRGRVHKSVAYFGQDCSKVEEFGELSLVLEEDFSKMTTGTEEAPDMDTDITIPQYLGFDDKDNPIENPEFQYPWNNMKAAYSQTPGWGAHVAYPAGGTLAFVNNESDSQSNLSTPLLDLSANAGTFVVELRVKAVGQTYPALLIETAETHNWAPSWDMFETEAVFTQLPTEWTTLRVVFQGGGPYTLVNIAGMISREQPEGTLLLDDVKVYSLKPKLETPVLTGHSAFTKESFKLNWLPVEGAESYVLNVFTVDDSNPYAGPVTTPVITDKTVTDTHFVVEDYDPTLTYAYNVTAVKGDLRSLRSKDVGVYDIAAPEVLKTEATDETGRNFKSTIEPNAGALGYTLEVLAKRTAEEDGPFTVTSLDFTNWIPDFVWDTPNVPDLTVEDPWYSVMGLYYPTNIPQQGWYGRNMMTYDGFLCLDPYHSTAGKEEVSFVSPEMDLSKDEGKISVDLKLYAMKSQYEDINNKLQTVYAKCCVALFNWNPELEDYEQAELVTLSDIRDSWKDYHIDFTKGTDRSVIAFFAIESFDNLYLDDIVIKQNYKKGETFLDPCYVCPWMESIGFDKPNEIEFTVPDFRSGTEFYTRAKAVRGQASAYGGYQNLKESVLGPTSLGGTSVKWESGVETTVSDLSSVNLKGNVLTVANPDAKEVALYDVAGHLVKALGHGTLMETKLSSKGVYIVKIGAKSVKVVY